MYDINMSMQVIELASTLALRTVNSCFDSITIARTVIGEGYIKQRYGEWKDMGYYIHNKRIYKCSECGTSEAKDTLTSANFCPNCGAKMKGGAG